MVIFLLGDHKELGARVLSTDRTDYTFEKLKDMETNLQAIYKGRGVKTVDTRGKTIAQVTKLISEIIHFNHYEPFGFNKRLKAIK